MLHFLTRCEYAPIIAVQLPAGLKKILNTRRSIVVDGSLEVDGRVRTFKKAWQRLIVELQFANHTQNVLLECDPLTRHK